MKLNCQIYINKRDFGPKFFLYYFQCHTSMRLVFSSISLGTCASEKFHMSFFKVKIISFKTTINHVSRREETNNQNLKRTGIYKHHEPKKLKFNLTNNKSPF